MKTVLVRSAVFALFWWALAEGRGDSWGVGLVTVALAVAASLSLSPPARPGLSVPAMLRFAGFFLVQSAKAGVQVAAMALRPRLDLAPAEVEVPITLPPGPARVLLANTLSLLPGTLNVHIGETTLRLHVLDRRLPVAAEVRETEARIARLFGMPA